MEKPMPRSQLDEWCETEAPKLRSASRLLPHRRNPLVYVLLGILFLAWLVYQSIFRSDSPVAPEGSSTDDMVRETVEEANRDAGEPAGVSVHDETGKSSADPVPDSTDEDSAAAVRDRDAEAARSAAQDADVRREQRERFLKELEQKSAKHEESLGLRLDAAERLHGFATWGLKVAAVATLAVASVGVVFVAAGLVTGAVVSGALALLPGSGTAIFWKLFKKSDETIQALSRDQEEAVKLLQAVQAVFLIADSVERDAAIARLVAQMSARA